MGRLFFILILIPLAGQTQRSPTGRWLAGNNFSTSFLKIKRSGKVTWFKSSCTNPGSTHTGIWFHDADTVTIHMPEDTITFIHGENRLCILKKDGTPTSDEYCIARTHAVTLLGVRRIKKRWIRTKRHQTPIQ